MCEIKNNEDLSGINELILPKFTLIIITRCNLRCKLCCEYVPQNKPFPDMTLEECEMILKALFDTVDRVKTLHLSGGGEPFLHGRLAGMIKACMEYKNRFERLMLFTNCTVMPSENLLKVLAQNNDRLVVQASLYGINPKREIDVLEVLECTGVNLKVEKYYGDGQSFGGWVDFGRWEPHGRTAEELECVFHNCAVTRDMRGNWRTRDGKVHWCSRSQRGLELGLIPDDANGYVDILNSDESVESKREKFSRISNCQYISACDYCSGDQGTNDPSKRFAAAEQI